MAHPCQLQADSQDDDDEHPAANLHGALPGEAVAGNKEGHGSTCELWFNRGTGSVCCAAFRQVLPIKVFSNTTLGF